jgi:hypothetical protein
VIEEVLGGRVSHRRTITISTVVSVLAICGVILPVLGVVLSPWIIGVMSNAMAGEIQGQVRQQLNPVNAGLKVIIESNIAQLEDDISSLQFRRDNDPHKWTEVDAQTLTNKIRRLASQRDALAAIKQAEGVR